MKKIKKIKIKINGKFKSIKGNYKILDLLKDLKVPLKKVAIELNLQFLLQYLIVQTQQICLFFLTHLYNFLSIF